MAEVVLSGAIRSNLLSIQNTTKLLDQTQNRLSTGLKVNSAVDDPTAFFQARSLSTRAGDLNTLLDSIQQGVQTLKAADEGIKAITKIVETAQATVSRAMQTPIIPTSVETTNNMFADPTRALTAVFGTASTNVITIAVDGGTPTEVSVGGKTVSAFVAAIDALPGVNAKLTSQRSLIIEGAVGRELVIADRSSSGTLAGTSMSIAGTYNNGTPRDKFETDFNDLRVQIDQLAQDASYQGVNLLFGDDLTVNFNETQTSQLTIRGASMTTGGDLNIPEVSARDFDSELRMKEKITQLKTAKRTLRTQASTFGGNLGVVQVRQDFTKQLINTLETGAADLTLADTNEEGANLLALRTRQQLASTALSIASQSDQNVLRLF